MTQVAKGSSSNGSSAVGTTAVFNLANEKDILKLLRNIHRGKQKQKVKNELRDAIFSLKSDGKGKKAALAALQAADFNVVFEAVATGAITQAEPSVSSSAPDKKPKAGLGRARKRPSFIAQTATSSAPKVVVNTTPPSAPTARPKPQRRNRPAMPPRPPAAPEPTVPHSKSVSKAAPIPPATPPSASTTPEPTPASPEPVTPPAPTPPVEPSTPTPEPTAAAAAAPDGDAAMARIKEIKRLMNEKIGNPVALIDLDNKVGRDYMNALLAAMKAVNGGQPGELDGAMEQLEAAFANAEKVIEAGPASAPVEMSTSPEPVPTPTTPKPTPASPEPVTPPAPTPPVEPSTPTPEPTPAPTETASSESVAPTPPEPKPEPANPAGGGNPVKINVSPNIVSSEPTVPPAAESVTPLSSAAMVGAPPAEAEASVPIANNMTAPTAAVGEVSPATTADAPAAPADAASPTRLMSVAKEEQLQNLMRQNQQKEAEAKQTQKVEAAATGDPLTSPEVTAGLKQLLSEWSLFKSSGFFGTGPGGIDHPLYKQMAGLTMAAVIAGRFEGATSQIKQSVTDYMNGWRYEEGITHDHGETFEHYLRRVIRHILDSKPVKIGE